MKYGTLVRIPESAELRAVCDEKFAAVAAMGLESCQLVYKPVSYKPEDADTIRESAKANGIEISAQFCGYRSGWYCWDNYYDYKNAGINVPAFREKRLEYLFSAIPFMKRLDVSDMVIHAGFIPNDPFESAYAEMLCSVRLIGTELKKNGMNLLFETGAESPVTLLRLICDSGLDNLFVNFDTANLIMYGYGNPVDAIYTFGKYIRNMHAKDGFPPTDPRKLGREATIGTGYVDFDKVFEQLHKCGYDRYVIIERELSGGNQNEEIEKAISYLKVITNKYYN
ncbi:MAG: sugar phosphate isomerase/epimerase [Clostridiales bacterium]|nr:sugar phosphate isomerase/epimerase [Clostridiales bacterium]